MLADSDGYPNRYHNGADRKTSSGNWALEKHVDQYLQCAPQCVTSNQSWQIQMVNQTVIIMGQPGKCQVATGLWSNILINNWCLLPQYDQQPELADSEGYPNLFSQWGCQENLRLQPGSKATH